MGILWELHMIQLPIPPIGSLVCNVPVLVIEDGDFRHTNFSWISHWLTLGIK